MNAPDILSNMSRGWNREASGTATGTERTSISAALWTHYGDDVQEVWAEPDPDFHILCLQLSSHRAEMFLNGRPAFDHRFSPGQINLVRAGERPRAVTRGNLKVLHVYVPTALLMKTANHIPCGPAAVPELIDPRCSFDPMISRIGLEILAEIRTDQPLKRLRIDALGQELTVQLLRRHSSWADRAVLQAASRGSRLAPWQLKRATEYLMDHMDADVSLADLAGAVRLSPFHFARAFKGSTGLPPQRFLMERRVERARELLAGSGMGLAEIALACGFASQSHFTTAFKRHMGFTPAAWRLSVRH